MGVGHNTSKFLQELQNYLTRGVNRALCKAVSHVAEDKTQAEDPVNKATKLGAARRRKRAVTRVSS